MNIYWLVLFERGQELPLTSMQFCNFTEIIKLIYLNNVQQFMKHLIEMIMKEDTRTSMKLLY